MKSNSKIQLFFILFLDLIAAISRGCVVVIVAHYVSVIENGGELLFGLEGKLGLSLQGIYSLLLLGGGVLLLLLSSASATYASAVKRRRIARNTHVSYATRVVRCLDKLHQVDLQGTGFSRQNLVQNITRNSLQSGIAVENLLNLFQPSLNIGISLSIIFFYDPWLASILLLVSAIILIPVVYIISDNIHKNSRNFFQSDVQAMARQLNGIVTRVNSAQLNKKITSDYQLIDNADYLTYLDGFDRNQLSSERMSLVVSLLRSAIISLGVIFFGWLALTGKQSWGALTGFLGGLMLMTNAVQAGLGLLANLNRFYPQIRQLYNFLSLFSTFNEHKYSNNKAVRLSSPSMSIFEDSLLTLELTGASQIGIYSPIALQRHSLVQFLSPLIKASNCEPPYWLNSTFISQQHHLEDETLLVAVTGEFSSSKKNWLLNMLKKYGSHEDLDMLTMAMEQPLDLEQWNRFSDRTQAALKLLALASRAEDVAFIDVVIINKLEKNIQQTFNMLFPHTLLFIVSNNNLLIDDFVDTFIVTNEKEIIGMGKTEWHNKNKEKIKKLKQNNKFIAGGNDDIVSML